MKPLHDKGREVGGRARSIFSPFRSQPPKRTDHSDKSSYFFGRQGKIVSMCSISKGGKPLRFDEKAKKEFPQVLPTHSLP